VDHVYWNQEKNTQLKRLRNVTFEDLIGSRFIGVEGHPVKKHQKLMLFEYKSYVWVVPYVQGRDYFFLKTAFPSRKHTKKYLGDKG
jgi:hypothetical protein